MGASQGKKALHRTLENIVAKAEVSKEDLALMFDSYVGTEEGAIMNVSQLRKIFLDIVAFQRSKGEKLFDAVKSTFYLTPDYKAMGFFERGAFAAGAIAFKAVLTARFDQAMKDSANDTKMLNMMARMSPDRRVTKQAFVANGASVIGAELVKSNLIVAKDVMERGIIR